MKYPHFQFIKLINYLAIVSKMQELDKDYVINNAFNIHFFIYTQLNYSNDNKNVKMIDGKRLFELDTTFELYPNNCNDANIETAIKKAANIIFS